VIQTENDYSRNVFNGDLGVIEKINRIEQDLVVNFEGRQAEYDFGDLDELPLAYVLSIHKNQGPESPCVVIPLRTQHYMMLQRNLLYPAVTRGKKLVVLVGTKEGIGDGGAAAGYGAEVRDLEGGCGSQTAHTHSPVTFRRTSPNSWGRPKERGFLA
jgi:ATP-dependent exoDNAse (exonuclease V) alpha subunit